VPIAGPQWIALWLALGRWDLALRRRHLKIAVPLLIVLTVVLVAVFADALAPFDPTAQHLSLP
jgi:hypothetical protein